MKIWSLIGIIVSLDIEIEIYGYFFYLYFVGWKINDKEWGGIVLVYVDIEFVVCDLVMGFFFVE